MYFNRLIAPENEILTLAQPLESIQRKGGSIAAPLRANPNKTCGARLGKRDQGEYYCALSNIKFTKPKMVRFYVD